jgi:hypothetical protein
MRVGRSHVPAPPVVGQRHLLEDHLVESLKIMEAQNETVKSVTARDCIINAVSIDN